MILSKEQMTELLEVSKPLIRWLNDNCHPHCAATVDQTSVVLSEGIATVITEEFIKD